VVCPSVKQHASSEMKERIRIGLMGSSCSGKTTTARVLARDLGLELQEEIESRLLAEWISSGRIRSRDDLHPELSREFQDLALRIRERNAERVVQGVSDRTAADLLVYNRMYVQPHFSEEYAVEFTARCRRVMGTYSHLFLFPLGVLPLEDNGIRTADRRHQEKVHSLLLQVVNEFSLSYVPLSPERLTIDERVEEIKQCLNQ